MNRKILAALLMMPLLPAAAAQAAPTLARATAAAVAVRVAEGMGSVQGTPAVSEGTLASAESAVMGVDAMPPGPAAAGLTGTAPADVVVMHGRFTDHGAEVPRGVAAPTGTVLELAVDASGRVVARHLADPFAPTAAAKAARTRRRARAAQTSTWPCGDEKEHLEHCYAVAIWEMPRTTEKIRGSEAQIETTEMFVPEPAQVSFVDNEEWLSFPERINANGPWWIEAGQTAGGFQPDPSRQMVWFWAYNNASGYHEGNPGWPEEGWVFHTYSMQSQLNGSWCVTVDGGSAGCVGGLLNYAKDAEVGGEYATPWQPANNMYDQVNYTSAGGAVKTWPRAEWFNSKTTCTEGFSRESPPHYYAGNVRTWVPC